MKKFAGHKPHATIKAQCKALRLIFDDRLYRTRGHDYVVVRDRNGAVVFYNTFNGKFFGNTPDGKSFSSSSTKYENEAWFQTMLGFFYVEEGTTGAERKRATSADFTLGGTRLLGVAA